MKKTFFLLCALLLVLGTLLPIAGYRLTLAVFGPAQGLLLLLCRALRLRKPPRTAPPCRPPIRTARAFLLADQSAGAVVSVPRREYLIGAVAAEMPISWPDEALKAQAIAAHSYALYCRDHTAEPASGWLSVDPVRRQGYLTDAVLRSYWGTAYEENYARLSALVDSVLTDVLYYGSAPAGASHFAMSNGMTEASEKVWGTALPYLVAVDSSTDLNADNYLYTVQFTAEQMQQALAGLGLLPDPCHTCQLVRRGRAHPFGLCSLPARLWAKRHRSGPAQRRWACGAPASRCSIRRAAFSSPPRAMATVWV